MSYSGLTAEARLPFASRRRGMPGYTLIELLVVVGIVAILSVALIGGFKRFQSSYQAGAALARVESALHYARNLAISNNAVYHVRFENVIVSPADGTPGKPLGTPQVPPLPPQSLAIYRFQTMSDALNELADSAHRSFVPGKWNPGSSIASTLPNAWVQTIGYNPGELVSLGGSIYSCTIHVNPGSISPDKDPTSWLLIPAYSNYLVERVDLPQGMYYGVQSVTAPATLDPDNYPLLYFRPDGSASSGFVLFVTDSLDFAEDCTGSLAAESLARANFYNGVTKTLGSNKQRPWMKVIQVYQGGMIKVPPLPTSTGLNRI